MKDIIWEKLTSFEKFIFIFGWFAALQVWFWIAMVVVYLINKEKKKYIEFFNPTTFKVPYVCGWIHFIVLIALVVAGFVFLSIVH